MSPIELIALYASIWITNPVPFLGAAFLGLLIGYFLSRIRYRGRIDVLEERIKGKDDTISLKDHAILSMSGAESVSHHRGQLFPPSQPNKTSTFEKMTPVHNQTRPQSLDAPPKDDRFREINARIRHETEDHIRRILLGVRFKLVFNPVSGASKFITFLEDGTIGEGRNKNEARWRIVDGRLEILEASNDVHSRFILLNDGRTFHHTNESDTKSIRGQYLVIA